MKKINVRILIVMLVVLMVSGCYKNNMAEKEGGKDKNAPKVAVKVNEKDFPIVQEPLEMDVLAPGVGMGDWNEMPTLKEYEAKTNLKMTYQTPPQSEFKTKYNLALSSGNLPDIIYAGGPNTLNAADEVKYGQEGLFVPLEDKLEKYAPNFWKLMQENPELKKSITTTDGHIYALPHITREDTAKWIMGPVWYNGAWLKALDVQEIPKTTDEFYQLMVRFRDEDPNGNGKKMKFQFQMLILVEFVTG